MVIKGKENEKDAAKLPIYIACLLDFHLYLTSLGQARQFVETCGT